MFNLFAVKVSGVLVGAASYPHHDSVQGNGRVVPVTLRQLLVLPSHNTINRAVKQGYESQLDDLTCIISKYKAVFIVKYLPQASRLTGLHDTREANHSRRAVIGRYRQVPPEPRILLHERPH